MVSIDDNMRGLQNRGLDEGISGTNKRNENEDIRKSSNSKKLKKYRKWYSKSLFLIDNTEIEKLEERCYGKLYEIFMWDMKKKPIGIGKGFTPLYTLPTTKIKILSGTAFGQDKKTKINFIYSTGAGSTSLVYYKKYFYPEDQPAVFVTNAKVFANNVSSLVTFDQSAKRKLLYLINESKP